MNFDILRHEVQEYIYANADTPVTKLALSKNPFPEIEFSEIINQIAARQKAKHKLPVWYAAKNIVYPAKISIEQSSSEAAAKYKAGLVSGSTLIDLTGGFGADDFYFAKSMSNVIHCEINKDLSLITAHNFKQLDVQNITCIAGDSLETLKVLDTKVDYIYIDPSRRNDTKGKVFMLKDCQPNVPELLTTYFSYSKNIIIKTAPILDITAGLTELEFVKAIHIVAVNNEVKELLWILERDYNDNPEIVAVNLVKGDVSLFRALLNGNDAVTYSLPQKYLYEPNSAIMKSGAFNAVSYQCGLQKLHAHSHLYTSENAIDFPGRAFLIQDVILYSNTGMKKNIEGRKLNITARNFPMTVEEIRKKWKVSDGGDLYAFFTTNINNEKIVLICSKI